MHCFPNYNSELGENGLKKTIQSSRSADILDIVSRYFQKDAVMEKLIRCVTIRPIGSVIRDLFQLPTDEKRTAEHK